MLRSKLDAKEFEALPEAQRGFYRKAGEHYVLDVDQEDVMTTFGTALLTNRDKLAAEKKALQAKLAKYEALGMAAEDLDAMVAAQKKAETERLTGQAQWERLKEQMAEQHQKELKKLADDRDFLWSLLEERDGKMALTEAVIAAGGLPELLVPALLPNIAVRRGEDGRPQTHVVYPDGPSRGQVRIKNASGDPMTVADLVAEAKAREAFAPAFRVKGASGGGGTASSGSGGERSTKVVPLDPTAILANLEGIAKGTVAVEIPS